MNKKLIIVILLISVVFCGCNYKRDKSEIEKIVSDFYITDYSYEETTEKYADDGSLILRLVYEGEVFQKPYKEHKKVISCDNFNRTANKQLNEIYFQGSDKAVTTYISTDDGWTKQLTTRNYPYGYAESITFSKIPDETFSTDHVDVYIGEYTVLLSSKNSSFQKLSATVTQKYYVDKENKVLTKIETDLTDLNRMRDTINYISVNGYSLEEAQKKVALDNEIKEINILNITKYGDPDDFQIPDIQEY